MLVEPRRPSILVVASPSPVMGGGGLRALRSLREYVKHFETSLVIPWDLWSNKNTLRDSATYLRELRELGVRFSGFSQLPDMIYRLRRVPGSRAFDQLMPLLIPGTVGIHVSPGNYDAIIALHEEWGAIYTGCKLAEHFNAPSMVLLQNPSFYGSKERFLNIVKSILLWRELRSDSPIEEALFKAEALIRELSIEHMRKQHCSKALRKYTLIVSVSKAIPIEMGDEWVNRIISLDPGVSLDYEDLLLIKRVRERVRSKENYIVFGGTPVATKGLAEALIVFKQILRRSNGLKLVVTGRLTKTMSMILGKMCRKLGIAEKVVFTGFIPRAERFEVIAKAKVMLNPSHKDAFPYTVLESLHLGTPVVGYKIPALEINYGGLPGVVLVDEWDLEALAVKTMEILEKMVDAVEPPKIKPWEEIMSEEVGLIHKLLEIAP